MPFTMRSSTFLLSASGATAALAAPLDERAPCIGNTCGISLPVIAPSTGGHATCISGYVDVNATTNKNIKFNYPIPANQTVVTETFLNTITPGDPFAQQIQQGQANVSGTYKIAVTLCTPKNNNKPTHVQFLTHGVGFDRSYWDFAPGYSYIDAAAQNGYATFSYDRLGVGLSAKPDPIQTIQAPFEVEIAHSLINSLAQGQYGGLNVTKVVGVGHSFGSIITQALTAQYPDLLDAAILTGFSTNSTAMPTFLQGLNLAIASQNQPTRFATLNNGFLVSDTAISNQIGFFRAPGFDPTILYKSEATKGTVTPGELFTTTAVTATAKQYTNPIAVVNGNNDLPFCFGNCSYPTNEAAAVRPALYPAVAADDFGTHLAPTTGHGLNLHYSAEASYKYIQDFINQHGLAA